MCCVCMSCRVCVVFKLTDSYKLLSLSCVKGCMSVCVVPKSLITQMRFCRILRHIQCIRRLGSNKTTTTTTTKHDNMTSQYSPSIKKIAYRQFRLGVHHSDVWSVELFYLKNYRLALSNCVICVCVCVCVCRSVI